MNIKASRCIARHLFQAILPVFFLVYGAWVCETTNLSKIITYKQKK